MDCKEEWKCLPRSPNSTFSLRQNSRTGQRCLKAVHVAAVGALLGFETKQPLDVDN